MGILSEPFVSHWTGAPVRAVLELVALAPAQGDGLIGLLEPRGIIVRRAEDESGRSIPPPGGQIVRVGVVSVSATAALRDADLSALRVLAARHPGRFAVVVDRMDDVGCEYVVFDAIRRRLLEAGIGPDLLRPVIVSSGEGVVGGVDRIDWHSGPTLVAWIDALRVRFASSFSGGGR